MDISGIAGEIVFATLKPNDLESVRDMIKRTPSLKEHNIQINHRINGDKFQCGI